MLPGPVVSVLLCQTEVDQEEFVTVATNTHQEVVWFDVAVDEVLVVDIPVGESLYKVSIFK